MTTATTVRAEQSFTQLSEGTCFCCGKKGHYSPKCPENDKRSRDQWVIQRGTQHLHVENEQEKSDDESTETNISRTTQATKKSDGEKLQGWSWSGLQLSLITSDDRDDEEHRMKK